MINQFYTTQWQIHLGGVDAFPRDLAYVKDPSPLSKRFKVYDWKSFVQQVWQHISYLDTFVSIFSDDQQNHNNYNTIFIDIDATNLQDAYDDVQKISKFAAKTKTISPRIYFSGQKGFHVYLDFEPTSFKHYKEVALGYVETLKDALGLQHVDAACSGDKKRVSRLPYTKHTSTGYLCIPIKPTMTLETIVDYAQGYRGDRSWIPLDTKPSDVHSKILENIDVHYVPPERSVSDPVYSFSMSQDLVHLTNNAHKFQGLNRIAYTKILPIFKARDRPVSEVINFIRSIEMRMGESGKGFIGKVDTNWIRSAYKIERGIPWSWSVIFRKWPEIRGWFKDETRNRFERSS